VHKAACIDLQNFVAKVETLPARASVARAGVSSFVFTQRFSHKDKT